MVERIRALLETRKLTPTQFADAIGVARPIVSHILSGRNKPSLEVVQRILAAMPDLSMPWLLNGTGPMLAVGVPGQAASQPVPVPAIPESRTAPAAETDGAGPQQPVALPKPVPAPAAVPLSSASPARQQAVRKVPPIRRFTPTEPKTTNASPAVPDTDAVALPLAGLAGRPAAEAAPEVGEIPPLSTPASQPAAPAEPAPAAESATAAALGSALAAGGDKPIRRIVIFYRDGSFADYQPE